MDSPAKQHIATHWPQSIERVRARADDFQRNDTRLHLSDKRGNEEEKRKLEFVLMMMETKKQRHTLCEPCAENNK